MMFHRLEACLSRRPARLWCATVAAIVACTVGLLPLRLHAQRGRLFLGSADDLAIQYSTAPLDNPVEDLNRRLANGSATLSFEGRSGYLRTALEALRLPAESQVLVYSQGSLQGRLISPANPRALFFNQQLALGWVRGGDVIEVAAHDTRVGVVFYTLEQRQAARPSFKREFRCLGCHMSGDTEGVPGLLMFSTVPDDSGGRRRAIEPVDHRTKYEDRFGGWFVTGPGAALHHRGNQVPRLRASSRDAIASVDGLVDLDGYRTATSDVVALLALSHQVQMVNLLTRASWEARAADPALHPGSAAQLPMVAAMMRGVAEEVVDYLLFVDEPPLPSPVAGRSPFAERLSSNRTRDRQGRSLYDLELTRRLLKYPCSYMIYSPAFDALPPLARTPIYQRLWQVLSGEVSDPRYRGLSLTDRQAIVEILKDTKPDLPSYFGSVTR